MSGILESFYNKRYSGKPSNFYITNKDNMTVRDSSLEIQGYSTFLSSSQRLPPFSHNFIHQNKDVNDINNIFLRKASTMTSLAKSYSTFLDSRSQTKRNRCALNERELILKEAQSKAEEMLTSSLQKNEGDLSYKGITPFKEEKSIDPKCYIYKRMMLQPDNSSIIKSREVLTKSLGTIEYCDQLFSGVKEYIVKHEKYTRLKSHFIRPSVSLFVKGKSTKQRLLSPQEMLKVENGLKPFKFYYSFPLKKRKRDSAKYPIDI